MVHIGVQNLSSSIVWQNYNEFQVADGPGAALPESQPVSLSDFHYADARPGNAECVGDLRGHGVPYFLESNMVRSPGVTPVIQNRHRQDVISSILDCIY
jgi:hypothetical protein